MRLAEKGSAGERLRSARLRAGFSQVGLAKKVGMGQETVSRIELGKRLPTTLQLEAIALALNVGMEWLLTGRKRA